MKTLLLTLLAAVTLLSMTGCSDDGTPLTAPDDPLSMTALETDALSSQNPFVIPPHAVVKGKTYAEWSVEWWRWLWSIPFDQNPGMDSTGDFVANGQSGSVWFLAPAYFSDDWYRRATIPAGKMLFIDLAAVFMSIQEGDGETLEELAEAARVFMDATTDVMVEVDGVALQNVEDYRVQSPGMFDYVVPENNMFEAFGLDYPAGEYHDGFCDGYYIMLAPLSAGQHTIHMLATFPAPYNDTIEVTFELTVAGRGRNHFTNR
ncbi:MAG TPA: hypothetical protein P5571_09170 [Candidatus Krumholzibacteria bacterium]|nr:hypothetical protein [Candidatus Krumholzibacteria bacterium]HRX51520.1 hypothetical protein [Candidatus Krumholzibacteria bacterium]